MTAEKLKVPTGLDVASTMFDETISTMKVQESSCASKGGRDRKSLRPGGLALRAGHCTQCRLSVIINLYCFCSLILLPAPPA